MPEQFNDNPRSPAVMIGIFIQISISSLVILWLASHGYCYAQNLGEDLSSEKRKKMEKIRKTAAEWEKILDPEQYRILREKGTERAFTGSYWDHKEKGLYICAGCRLPLFDSETKFRSGTGWPSFTQPIHEHHIQTLEDRSFGVARTEVLCRRCDGHLGHVFRDGPPPTRLRYCINSVAMLFVNKEKSSAP
ncbi:MAG: peptide-methionine (R)-S-oxide reductase MsrB [Cytophagales bacterium]|nr:peptide-methionine (R)-S-oxide reductase MsrB [Cytophagales bacterium]